MVAEGADPTFQVRHRRSERRVERSSHPLLQTGDPLFLHQTEQDGVKVDRAQVQLRVAEEGVVSSSIGTGADDAHAVTENDSAPVAGQPDDLVFSRFEISGVGGVVSQRGPGGQGPQPLPVGRPSPVARLPVQAWQAPCAGRHERNRERAVSALYHGFATDKRLWIEVRARRVPPACQCAQQRDRVSVSRFQVDGHQAVSIRPGGRAGASPRPP